MFAHSLVVFGDTIESLQFTEEETNHNNDWKNWINMKKESSTIIVNGQSLVHQITHMQYAFSFVPKIL